MKPIKRSLDDVMHELDGVTDILSSMGYLVHDGTKDLDLTREVIASQLWGMCNYIQRINETIAAINEESNTKPIQMTETTVKTIIL